MIGKTLRILLCGALFFALAGPCALPCLADTNPLIIEAATLFRQDKYQAALERLAQIKNPGQDTSAINFLKGYIYMAKLQPEVSRSMFAACLNDLNFTLPDYAQFGIAGSYFASRDYDSAIWEYKKFIIDHGDSVLVPDAMLEIGRSLSNAGRHKEAAEAFSKMIKEFPSSYLVDEARFLLGQTYENLGMAQKAAAVYHNLNIEKPRSAYVKQALARLEKMGDRSLGFEYVEKEKLFNYAMGLFDQRKYKEAEKAFGSIASGPAKDPLTDEALLMLGRCKFRQGQYPQAAEYFRKVIGLAGNRVGDAYYYLGLAHETMGDNKGAIKAFGIVVDYFASSAFADESQYRTAAIYRKMGALAQARQAYKKLASKFPASQFVAESAFDQGFANYKEENHENAFKFFSQGADSNSSWQNTAKCLFWKAKSAEKMGKKNDAIQAYQEIVDRFDHTYYAFRSAARLEKEGFWIRGPSVRADENNYVENYIPYSENSQLEINEIMDVWGNLGLEGKGASVSKNALAQTHYDKYKLLMEMRMFKYAAKEAAEFVVKSSTADKNNSKVTLALALMAGGEYRTPIRFAEKLVDNRITIGRAKDINPDIWMLSYPRGFWYEVQFYASRHNVDPYLVLAVIREESRFNSQATSRSFALGLMQMMPRTGRGVAKVLDIDPFYTGWLFNPNVNIYMGSYYLSNLMKRFDNNKILALAGYNGGPNRVAKWAKKWEAEHGNIDYDEFVENIPLSETRNYVKKVLSSYYEYKKLYEGKRG